jgi:3-hydroxyisobutyrate dehydrogenase
MGAPMAQNFVAAGFDVTVWNRTTSRVAPVVERGARAAGSLVELARRCDVVVLSLTDSPDVELVLFADAGLVEGLARGSLVVDCSTISPERTRAFADRLGARGVGLVDAPVSGGSEGASRGTLSIMVGGRDEDVARAEPLLRAMGTTVTHLGPVGSGQWAKALNQVILAGVYLAVAEGVTLGLKAGLDVTRSLGALREGAAGSWVLSNRADRMIDNEYPLGFKLRLHRKDLAIALELARAVGAALPVASLAATLEDGLIGEGCGDEDNAALARAVRRLAGL